VPFLPYIADSCCCDRGPGPGVSLVARADRGWGIGSARPSYGNQPHEFISPETLRTESDRYDAIQPMRAIWRDALAPDG
jgi:hypothetical protein